MTGKELILYILQNNLENDEVFHDGRFLDFLTVSEAAVKFNVGTAVVNTWLSLGTLTGIKIGDTYYIPRNAEPTDLRDLKTSHLKTYVNKYGN